MAVTNYSDSDYSPIYKRTYGQLGDNLYGTGAEDPVESQVKKTYGTLKGSEKRFPVKVGFGGGTSFGTLGQANMSKYVDVVLTAKNAYVRMMLDRKSIVLSKGNDAAFIEATKEETTSKLKSFMRTQVCAFFNHSNGILGQFSGSQAGTAAAPVVTIIDTGTYRFRPAFFEEGDYINVNSLTTVWEITAVDLDAKTLTLARISGSDDLTGIGAGTHSIYLQNSKDVCPTGFKEVVEASSSTLFGVTVQRRWRASYQETLSVAALITVDRLNKGMLQIDNRSGESPNLIAMSTIQMEKFLNGLEDQKRYPITTLESRENSKATAKVSFSAIQFMSINGAVPVVSSRYIRNDAVYFMNMNHIERMHSESFGWFDEDRTILLRMQDLDAYEARYGGYYENYINPLYHGYLYGLAV